MVGSGRRRLPTEQSVSSDSITMSGSEKTNAQKIAELKYSLLEAQSMLEKALEDLQNFDMDIRDIQEKQILKEKTFHDLQRSIDKYRSNICPKENEDAVKQFGGPEAWEQEMKKREKARAEHLEAVGQLFREWWENWGQQKKDRLDELEDAKTTIEQDIEEFKREIKQLEGDDCDMEEAFGMAENITGSLENDSNPEDELGDWVNDTSVDSLRRLAAVSPADTEIRTVRHQGTDHATLITMSAMFLLFMFLFRRWAAKRF